jgi:hypothetical protein
MFGSSTCCNYLTFQKDFINFYVIKTAPAFNAKFFITVRESYRRVFGNKLRFGSERGRLLIVVVVAASPTTKM